MMATYNAKVWTGTEWASIGSALPDLNAYVNKAPTASQPITSGGPSVVPIQVVGSPSQTANVFEAKNSAGSTVFSISPSGTIYAPGTVVQSVRAVTTTYQSITSTTPVALSGLSVSITPKFSNSLILIQGMVTASWSYVSSLHIYRNGSDIVPNHGANSQSGGANSLFTHYQSSQEGDRTNQLFPFPVLYWDSPATTSATTYDFRANSGWSGGSVTFYLNSRSSDDMRSNSTIVVTEIAQ